MTEFGIFSDEGLLEGGFCSNEEADRAIASRYSEEDGVHAGEICGDHPEHEVSTCEECNSEDESEGSEAEEE